MSEMKDETQERFNQLMDEAFGADGERAKTQHRSALQKIDLFCMILQEPRAQGYFIAMCQDAFTGSGAGRIPAENVQEFLAGADSFKKYRDTAVVCEKAAREENNDPDLPTEPSLAEELGKLIRNLGQAVLQKKEGEV